MMLLHTFSAEPGRANADGRHARPHAEPADPADGAEPVRRPKDAGDGREHAAFDDVVSARRRCED